MCDDRFKLIPVVILVAALIAGLIIAFGTGVANYMTLFILAFVLGLVVLVVTGALAAVCGFNGIEMADEKRGYSSLTCRVIRCLGPVAVVAALLTIILAAIALAGVLLTAIADLVVGIILTITASTALVYFTAIFFDIIVDED